MKKNGNTIFFNSLFALILTLTLFGCNFKKSQTNTIKKIPLTLKIYVEKMDKDQSKQITTSVRSLLALCMSPGGVKQSEKNQKNKPALLLLPKEARIKRLDCPEDPPLVFKDWKSWSLKVAEALSFRGVSRERYLIDWNKFLLSNVTEEILKQNCKAQESAPDFSQISDETLDERTYFYIFNPKGKAHIPAALFSIPKERIKVMDSPSSLWANVYKGLEKESEVSRVDVIILCQTSPPFSCPSSKKIYSLYLNGKYEEARDLLAKAKKCQDEKGLKSLVKRLNAPLAVEMSLEYVKNDKHFTAQSIDQNLVLTPATPYSLNFKIEGEQPFLYVFQVDSTGKVDVVYPSERHCETANPIEKDAIRCPSNPKHWFTLDENIGTERLYVLASTIRNQFLEKMIQDVNVTGIKDYLFILEKSSIDAPGVFFNAVSFMHEK